MKRIWRFRYTTLCVGLIVLTIINDAGMFITHHVDWNKWWPGFLLIPYSAFTAIAFFLERRQA